MCYRCQADVSFGNTTDSTNIDACSVIRGKLSQRLPFFQLYGDWECALGTDRADVDCSPWSAVEQD